MMDVMVRVGENVGKNHFSHNFKISLPAKGNAELFGKG